MKNKLSILELFAGVGGFRIGLDKTNHKIFQTNYANQFEPSRKNQDAFDIYNYHFSNSKNLNIDINKISDDEFKSMNVDMIVGGFPCQDYSVAKSKHNELGIKGKKGVLFWQIIRAAKVTKPHYMLFENVDRLLKAPASQKGRDFAIMQSALNKLNYSLEWRVINAADYGNGQRRRRTYIFVFKNDTSYAKHFNEEFKKNPNQLIFKDGLFAKAFPIQSKPFKNRQATYQLPNNTVAVSNTFSGKIFNTGVMSHGIFYTAETKPINNEKLVPLKNTLQSEKEVSEKYYITDKAKINRFKYLRSAKKLKRTTQDGHTYYYSEGNMSPYEDLNLPSRTMLTSEGNVNRSTHFLKINGRYRILTPIEAERLQAFPDNWTKYKLVDDKKQIVSDRMRMFIMGNALVTNVITRIGNEIENILIKYEK